MCSFVFIGHAKEDELSAKRLASGLKAAGIEVWLDVDRGLRGGDAWERKIYDKIKECALFLPLISLNTERRTEGFFRVEWDYALKRGRGISENVQFLVPIILDSTSVESAKHVPEKFRDVQWTRLPDGIVTTEFTDLIADLIEARTGNRPTFPGDLGNVPFEVGSERIRPTKSAAEIAPVGHASRLLAVSTRVHLQPRTPLVTGISFSGTAPTMLLIRAVGPGLARFGIPSPMPDPKIELFGAGGGIALAVNDGWFKSPDVALPKMTAIGNAVGAFPLQAGLMDAAIVHKVPPGAYTVIVQSRSGKAGEVLLEIYQAPA